MDFGKARTKEAALSSYRTYYSNVPQNLPINAFVALQNLSKNKDLIFQKSDNDNSVVIGDRQDYRKKMNNVLSDQKKITTVNLKDVTLLNFAVSQEKHVDKVFKKLVESNMKEKRKNHEIFKTWRQQTRYYERFM